jgi:peroxiredoxin
MLSKNPPRLAALALVALLSGVAFVQPAGAQGPVEFRLRTTEGGEITSEMLRGDVVVLAFGASWLPLSREQVQAIQEVADHYTNRDVRVYWVSTDSESPKSKNHATDEQLRVFARKYGLKVAVLRDPDGAFFKRLGVRGNQLPAAVILDRTGQISGEPFAGIDSKAKLVEQLSTQLNGLVAAK